MYDFSGEWMLRVGLPAKSGVSGGVMAVAPSQFGVAAFSPRLDEHGNSVRAQRDRRDPVGAVRDARSRAAREHRRARRSASSDTAERAARATGRRAGVRRGGARALDAARDRRGLAHRRADHGRRERTGTHRTRRRSWCCEPRSTASRRRSACSCEWSAAPAAQTRRSSVIDIASVLCRCGHSCARPDPSFCGGRPGSAPATLRQHLARIELLDRAAELAAHLGRPRPPSRRGAASRSRRRRRRPAGGLRSRRSAARPAAASARAHRPATCASAPRDAGEVRRGPCTAHPRGCGRTRPVLRARTRPSSSDTGTSSGTPAIACRTSPARAGRDLVRLEASTVLRAPRRRARRSCRPGPAHRSSQRSPGATGSGAGQRQRGELRAFVLHAEACRRIRGRADSGSPPPRRKPIGEYGVRRASSGIVGEPGQGRHRDPRRRVVGRQQGLELIGAPFGRQRPPERAHDPHRVRVHQAEPLVVGARARRDPRHPLPRRVARDAPQHRVGEPGRAAAARAARELDGLVDGRVGGDAGRQQLVDAEAQRVEHGRVDLLDARGRRRSG